MTRLLIVGRVMRAQLQRKPDVTHETHEQVIMRFWQTNVGDGKRGRRSGHKVVIPALTDQPRPIVYQSDYAEERIKHEIAEAEDNIYRKGFLVPLIYEHYGERLLVYHLVEVHAVFDVDDPTELTPSELPSPDED